MQLKMLNPCLSVPSLGKLGILIQPNAKKRGSGHIMPALWYHVRLFHSGLYQRKITQGKFFSSCLLTRIRLLVILLVGPGWYQGSLMTSDKQTTAGID